MNVKEYIKKNTKRKDLKTYLLENIEDLAEEHLDIWQENYLHYDNEERKDKVKIDLYSNRDPSEEFTMIEEALNRKLVDEEIDVVFKAFNEEVLNKI